MTAEGLEIELSGTVVRGDQRGRELGFPTANVEVDPGGPELPQDGVYAGRLEVAEPSPGAAAEPKGDHPPCFLAAISIGSRPTYYGEHAVRLVEAYLLDFEGDLYGKRVNLCVGARVRGQERFSGSADLIAQMHRDVEAVRQLATRGM